MKKHLIELFENMNRINKMLGSYKICLEKDKVEIFGKEEMFAGDFYEMETYSSYQKTKRYRVKGTSIFITLN